MGLFDFFKKQPERVVISDPSTWVVQTEKKIIGREQKTLIRVKERIAQFHKELEELLPILETVDISHKNVPAKAKVIVQKNLDNYILHVKNFAKIELGESLEEVVARINTGFADLQKKTHVSYQKATYLVGKEIAAVHKSIGGLSRDLKKIVDEDLIVTSRRVGLMKEKLAKKAETKKLIQDLEAHIKSVDTKMKRDKAKEKERVERVKKSEKYLESLKQRQEQERLEKILTEELHVLKSLIDFKALGHVFHSSKKMAEVTAYKNNFADAFHGKQLQALLEEAKQDTHTERVARIEELKRRITAVKKSLRNAPVIQEEDFVILEEEVANEKKKLQKLKNNMAELEEEIRAILDEANK